MRIRSRTLNWVIVAAVVFASRLLFRTLRIQLIAADPRTNPYATDIDEGYVYCVWHDEMMVPVFAGRHDRTVALVSKHQDGSYLALGLKMLGIGTVRGSSSRHGLSAVRELLRLPKRMNLVLTPDGPRGPRRRIKPGLVFLASHSGRPIVPTAFAPVRSWRIPGTWTDLMVPKPFTKVYAITGHPMHVPPGASSEQMAALEAAVQSEMDRLAEWAERLAARPAAIGRLRTASS